MIIETTKELYQEAYKIGTKLRQEGRYEEADIIQQCALRLVSIWEDGNKIRKVVGLEVNK